MAKMMGAALLQEQHNKILERYSYVPTEDGSLRNTTEDEQLMLSYLFYKAAYEEELENASHYGRAQGVIFWHEDMGCPCAQCYVVDMVGKACVFGIEVNGYLNKPEHIRFFCINDGVESLAFFPALSEAIASPLSTPPKKRRE